MRSQRQNSCAACSSQRVAAHRSGATSAASERRVSPCCRCDASTSRHVAHTEPSVIGLAPALAVEEAEEEAEAEEAAEAAEDEEPNDEVAATEGPATLAAASRQASS